MMAAVSRKTEVTKLITVTLGKIQESKHAKCGLNLRKSLLVASVLHKARDIYVTEVKSRVVDNTNSSIKSSNNNNHEDSSEDYVPVPAKVRRFSSQRSMSVIEEEPVISESQNTSEPNSSAMLEEPTNEVIITTPVAIRPPQLQSSSVSAVSSTAAHSTAVVVNDILDELATSSEVEYTTTTDKENNPPPNPRENNNITSSAVSCGRCLKRRASTDYLTSSDTESSDSYTPYTPSSYYLSRKRSRSNSVDASELDNTTSDEISKPCAMDTTQINSLVNIFSQSFPEFTTTDTHDAGSVYETSTEMNTFALCRDSIALTA